MRASEIIELLAMAIDGKGIPGDMPSTEDLLWAYFYACEEAGADRAEARLIQGSLTLGD